MCPHHVHTVKALKHNCQFFNVALVSPPSGLPVVLFISWIAPAAWLKWPSMCPGPASALIPRVQISETRVVVRALPKMLLVLGSTQRKLLGLQALRARRQLEGGNAIGCNMYHFFSFFYKLPCSVWLRVNSLLLILNTLRHYTVSAPRCIQFYNLLHFEQYERLLISSIQYYLVIFFFISKNYYQSKKSKNIFVLGVPKVLSEGVNKIF